MTELKRDFKGVWIPKEVWLDERLGALDKIILVEIDSLDNGDERGCYATNKYIAEFCQCSERKVTDSISLLIKLGYLELGKFDGRVRELRSNLAIFAMRNSKNYYSGSQNLRGEVAKNVRRSSKKFGADTQNLRQNNINNNINNNLSINQRKNKKKVDGLIDDGLIESVKKQIDYDLLKNQFSKDLLDTVVSCVAEMSVVSKPQTFNNCSYEADVVKKHSQAINSELVTYVLNNFSQSGNNVKNISAYLKTSLFNSIVTYKAHAESKVHNGGFANNSFTMDDIKKFMEPHLVNFKLSNG